MFKHNNSFIYHGIAIVFVMVAMFFFSACSPSHKGEVDRLNTLSYAFHYRNLDSTKVLAERALCLSDDYSAGYAEACNNLAFVAIAKMNYKQAKTWLDMVEAQSDNQLELLIADIQNMRLCQREARNKDFYNYREMAMRRLRRIGEEADNLPLRERKRAIYARSEFDIVAATYFYYVQLSEPMQQALQDIDAEELEQDTAQYLNYLYNIGAGGAITEGTSNEINQKELDYLLQCYILASSGTTYPYWQANALQAISEHIQDPTAREFLIKNNLPAFHYLNVEQMPNNLLAGNLAQRSLNLFAQYGDVYQIAGSYRTLAECYWLINDYASAEKCLLHALNDNKAIKQAPDLVASIRERLSLVYSAVDDKPKSDYNRNIYLDLQEFSRQDRQLEARAAQLDNNAILLNSMIAAVVFMILLVVCLLYVFDRMKRKSLKADAMDDLLKPLNEWNNENTKHINELREKKEEIDEDRNIVQLHIQDNKKRNLEQRAKVSLVTSITPFIDRMVHEVERLVAGGETKAVRQERYQYISELTDKINQYNHVLTEWIQMRQGTLSLHIESFELQPLFDIVAKGRLSFQMNGVTLHVEPTAAVVKADRTLTLFMINTIADNARKFTPRGGHVMVSAQVVNATEGAKGQQSAGYVEISVIDTGCGMDEQALTHVFDRAYTGGHGFGLINCKGIIDKYKKISSLFSVCSISASSEVGKGSRFSFRLPCGIRRMKMLLLLLFSSCVLQVVSAQRRAQVDMPVTSTSNYLKMADAYADSAYFSNINGTYERTLSMADSSRSYLNRYYLSLHPGGTHLMMRHPKTGMAAELLWFQDSLPTHYNVILDIRNESAVAALALHKWDLYESNNGVYTQLFREMSADSTLGDYVRTMQMSENSKAVAIVLLILLLLQLPLAYYWLYYRHVLNFRFALDKVNAINKVLLSDKSNQEKLSSVSLLWNRQASEKNINMKLDQVVRRIEKALTDCLAAQSDETKNIEMAEDDLHRAEYENSKLHISNSVLDNCLSALKHETMYYPSRIRQLIDTHPEDVESLHELVDYYKQLYTLLSAQAMEQVEIGGKLDKFLFVYLMDILEVHDKKQTQTTMETKGEYVVYKIEKMGVAYQEERHQQLFTPLTCDMKYLLCRQIVREMGEITNLRGCGIMARPSVSGGLEIDVTMPRQMVSGVPSA